MAQATYCGDCVNIDYCQERGGCQDPTLLELAALRARVRELEAEVAALRATATTPPWRAGPRG